MQVVFNPSPMEPDLLGLHLKKVHCLVLNQVGRPSAAGRRNAGGRGFAPWLEEWFQGIPWCSPLGSRGAWCLHQGEWVFQKVSVPVVDTTGAGDAFTGFFVWASRMMGQSIPRRWRRHSRARAAAQPSS